MILIVHRSMIVNVYTFFFLFCCHLLSSVFFASRCIDFVSFVLIFSFVFIKSLEKKKYLSVEICVRGNFQLSAVLYTTREFFFFFLIRSNGYWNINSWICLAVHAIMIYHISQKFWFKQKQKKMTRKQLEFFSTQKIIHAIKIHKLPFECASVLFVIADDIPSVTFCFWLTRLFDLNVDCLLVGVIATRFSDGGSEVVLVVDCIVLFGEYRLSNVMK